MARQLKNGHDDKSALNAVAVTPSDTVDLTTPARMIYVGGAGNVTLITLNGDQVLFTALAVGVVHRITAARILATGTTATAIVALY